MFKYFFRSLLYSLKGVYSFFRTERNGKLQAIIGMIVILGAFYFQISRQEWIFILLCVFGVISFEMINSSLERLCNLHTKEFHPDIKFIKDVAAAAVLLISIASAIIGCIIFYPYVLQSI